MAYSTGTVLGSLNLLSAIDTFLTANGWTLHDNLGTYDKVYRSTGTDGLQNLYIRLSLNVSTITYSGGTVAFTSGATLTQASTGATAKIVGVSGTTSSGTLSLVELAGNFVSGAAITDSSGGSATSSSKVTFSTWKDPRRVENALEWILVRAYNFWNATTHVGTGETGNYGPYSVSSPNTNSNFWAFWRPNYTTIANSGFSWDGNNSTPRDTNQWDGIRRSIANPNTSTSMFCTDMAANVSTAITAHPQGVPNGSASTQDTSGVMVFNRSAGTYHFYSGGADSSTNNDWARFDFSTNTWTQLAQFASLSGSGGCQDMRLCWDGGDYIYAGRAGGTGFARYSISGNSWTAMAAAPAAPSGVANPTARLQNGIYVPAGVIPAVTEDVIYFVYDSTTIMRRYNVASNTWGSHVNFPFTLSAATEESALWWDGSRYIYLAQNTSGSPRVIWRLDTNDIAAGWTSIQGWPYDMGTNAGVFYMNHNCGKIKSATSATSITYHLVGDADSVVVCTVINSAYYWSVFGKAESLHKNSYTTTSASITAGATSITVLSNSGFSAGDRIVLLDTSNGSVESTTIISTSGLTTINCPVVGNYTSGTKVFIDRVNTFIASDGFLGVFTYDLAGYQGEGAASSWRLQSSVSATTLNRAGLDSYGQIQSYPIQVFNNATGLCTYTTRANVPKVKVTGVVTGGAASGDTVLDENGQTWLAVYPEHFKLTNDVNTMCLIGPIA